MYEIKATQGDFFILASAQFWNVVSYEEAVNFALARREYASERIAHELCQYAYKKVYTDISVIFINVT